MVSLRSYLVAINLSLLNICWGLVASIQAPFFPIEAAQKGASATEFGGVFGIIHLAIFITSPLMGKFVSLLGLSNIFKFGLLLSCVSAISFGLLTYVENKIVFLVGAYSLRLIEGVGGAALWTSMLALLLAW